MQKLNFSLLFSLAQGITEFTDAGSIVLQGYLFMMFLSLSHNYAQVNQMLLIVPDKRCGKKGVSIPSE